MSRLKCKYLAKCNLLTGTATLRIGIRAIWAGIVAVTVVEEWSTLGAGRACVSIRTGGTSGWTS